MLKKLLGILLLRRHLGELLLLLMQQLLLCLLLLCLLLLCLLCAINMGSITTHSKTGSIFITIVGLALRGTQGQSVHSRKCPFAEVLQCMCTGWSEPQTTMYVPLACKFTTRQAYITVLKQWQYKMPKHVLKRADCAHCPFVSL